MATILVYCGIAAAGGSWLEKNVLEKVIPVLYEPSIAGLPRAVGFVLFLLSGFSFWLTAYGMNIGRARTKYKEKAEKDGEKDLDRYMLPNLYVTGTSPNAIAFNSVQRSHQQVFESLTQFYMTSVVASLCFPLLTALSCLLWCLARATWAKDYAERGPSGRYNHFMARFIWYSLILNYMLALLAAVTIIVGRPLY